MRSAVTERTEQAGTDRVVVRETSVADTCTERAVHILEVNVPNARSRYPRDLERVRATKRDVTCVEAQRVRAALKEPLDVRRPLDRGAPVWMHGDAETVRAGDLGDAVDSLEQLPPGTVRDRGNRAAHHAR